MEQDNVIDLKAPAVIADPLTEILRNGARQLLAVAVETEIELFLSEHREQKTQSGLSRFVRNGRLPDREIQTGIGPVSVSVPRVRDRAPTQNKIEFSSAIVPKYLRKTASVNELLPLLYLKGISVNDFQEVLSPILGAGAKNLSPGVISRLKSTWEQEYNTFRKRKLNKRYVYLWADGVYLQARMTEGAECVLVIIGVAEQGVKEVLAIEGGVRESKESWLSVLYDLKARGLTEAPKLAVGDGALGFWGALSQVYEETRHQRCWFHKMGNVLNYLPKSQQPRAKKMLQDIWMAATRNDATVALNAFVQSYEAKYPKACTCLKKDRDALLEFYNYPAEQWAHLRTSNPIESAFATVRHRTYKAKGCFSQLTILTMVFKLCESAQSHWRKLRGFSHLADVVRGVQFINGMRQNDEVVSVSDRIAA